MKVIAEITDKTVLGLEGRSSAPPRYTARAIVKNGEGLYAVMHSYKHKLYSLPGGGVEENEDGVSAVIREVAEETGCACDTIEELGAVIENRNHADYTQVNEYYLVTTLSSPGKTHLTAEEISNQTVAEWHTLEEVFDLIRTPVHDTNQKKFLQARDVIALKAYMKIQGK